MFRKDPHLYQKKKKKNRPTSPIHLVGMVALTPCLGELTPHIPSGEEEHYWTKICKLYHFFMNEVSQQWNPINACHKHIGTLVRAPK